MCKFVHIDKCCGGIQTFGPLRIQPNPSSNPGILSFGERALGSCLSHCTRRNFMTVQNSFRYGAVTLLLVIALFAVGGSSASAQRIENNVPAGVQVSRDLGLA